jgi:nicotinamidase/pyrazinamidase
MKALLLVDLQNDFLPGGALGVSEGDQVIQVANRLQRRFELVVATQDWHPPDHGSFAANHPGKHPGEIIELHGLSQILWPVHCVQNTPGAAFAPGLDTSRFARVFRKGTDPKIDSYSTFYDNGHRRATGLGDFLRARKVTDLFIAGLATDYCVKFSALDAMALGLRVHVLANACRGVNLSPGDVAQAVAEMKKAGVEIIGRAAS